MIRIAVVDDDMAFLEHLKQEFDMFVDIEILFTASNGVACLQSLQAIEPTQLPNIILMDILMPKLDGIHATNQIAHLYPHIHVVMLTTFEDDDKILACIQAGAKGYLLKTEKIPFILETLGEVLSGGSQMSASIARKVFRLLQEDKHASTDFSNKAREILTDRENQILAFIKEGKKYKKIGELLFIEESTVKKHIRHIYEKLGAHNKIEAIRYYDNNIVK